MNEKQISRPDRSRQAPFETLVGVLAAANRYDFLLAVVPVAFAVALVVATVANVSTIEAMVGAAVVGVLVIVDACYRNPPTDQGTT